MERIEMERNGTVTITKEIFTSDLKKKTKSDNFQTTIYVYGNIMSSL